MAKAEAKEIELTEPNKGGRPPLFKTDAELKRQIETYFETLKGARGEDEEGKPIWIVYPEPATITGLAFHLGFESRQSIYDYENNGKFSYTIKRARLLIENAYEKALFNAKNAAGPIFGLKNMGWTDRRELTGAEGNPLIPIVGMNIKLE